MNKLTVTVIRDTPSEVATSYQSAYIPYPGHWKVRLATGDSHWRQITQELEQSHGHVHAVVLHRTEDYQDLIVPPLLNKCGSC